MLTSLLARRSKRVHDLWNTKLGKAFVLETDGPRVSFFLPGSSLPVLVTDPISNGDVWKVGHDSPGGRIHEVKGTFVVRLFETIFRA